VGWSCLRVCVCVHVVVVGRACACVRARVCVCMWWWWEGGGTFTFLNVSRIVLVYERGDGEGLCVFRGSCLCVCNVCVMCV